MWRHGLYVTEAHIPEPQEEEEEKSQDGETKENEGDEAASETPTKKTKLSTGGEEPSEDMEVEQ